MLTFFQLLPRGANTYHARITEVGFILCSIGNRTEPCLLLTQPCQGFKESLVGSVPYTQANIDIIAEVVAEDTRFGLFDVDQCLLDVSTLEGKDDGPLIDATFLL